MSGLTTSAPQAPERGRLALADALSVVLALASLSLSFVSFSSQVYVSIFAVGANALLTCVLPAVAIVVTLLGRTIVPRLESGILSLSQLQFVVAVGAAIGWLNVLWAGLVPILGLILSVLWILLDAARRLIPALQTASIPLTPARKPVFAGDAGSNAWATTAAPVTAAANIFPSQRSAQPASSAESAQLAAAHVPAQPAAESFSPVTRPNSVIPAPLVAPAPVADVMAEPTPQDDVAPADRWAPAPSAPRAAAVDPVPEAAEAMFRAHGERAAVVEPPAHQPFWVLVPEERGVVDENGHMLFVVSPTAWALAIEERPDALVLRDFDGRVGTLTNVTGVIRN